MERKFRETRQYEVAPVSTNLILSYLVEHVRCMPLLLRGTGTPEIAVNARASAGR